MKKQISYTAIKIVAAFYFLFLPAQLWGQLCNSLGGSVVHTTFGSGPNPGGSLPPGKTNYLYTTDPCPSEGYYTIVNSVSQCFGNSWYALTEDNTPGDVNGYLMVINAAVTPGDVYVDTVNNLCGNTNFVFFATVFNLSLPTACGGHPLRPRLTFSAENLSGTILGSYNTGDIPESPPSIYIYNFSFRTPPGINTVIIRIRDDAPGGCGNDFTLDNIQLGPCGPVIQVGFVSVLGTSLDICTGDPSSTTLFATVGQGYNAPSYQWQIFSGTDWVNIPGATSLMYVRNATTGTGTYKYRLAVAEGDNINNINCCVVSDELVVNVNNPLTGTATSNSPVCVNSMLSLSATGGTDYQWFGPANFFAAEANPVFKATAAAAGQYKVIITDATGCRNTLTTTVSTIAPPTVVVSNTKNICTGDSIALQASGGISYAWLPVNNLSGAATSNPVTKPFSTTRYTVTVIDNNNCSDTASVLVVVNTKPIVSAGADKAIIKGQSVILDGSINNTSNVSFSWIASSSLNNISSLNPVANPVLNTDYVLTALSNFGCGITADTVLVKVYIGVFIPNAFSPNGDGLNDTWHIPALQAFPGARVVVYNRYGNKIFESNDGSRDWDGTYKNSPQPSGAYVYVIDLKNNKPVIKGAVIIVR